MRGSLLETHRPDTGRGRIGWLPHGNSEKWPAFSWPLSIFWHTLVLRMRTSFCEAAALPDVLGGHVAMFSRLPLFKWKNSSLTDLEVIINQEFLSRYSETNFLGSLSFFRFLFWFLERVSVEKCFTEVWDSAYFGKYRVCIADTDTCHLRLIHNLWFIFVQTSFRIWQKVYRSLQNTLIT